MHRSRVNTLRPVISNNTLLVRRGWLSTRAPVRLRTFLEKFIYGPTEIIVSLIFLQYRCWFMFLTSFRFSTLVLWQFYQPNHCSSTQYSAQRMKKWTGILVKFSIQWYIIEKQRNYNFSWPRDNFSGKVNKESERLGRLSFESQPRRTNSLLLEIIDPIVFTRLLCIFVAVWDSSICKTMVRVCFTLSSYLPKTI